MKTMKLKSLITQSNPNLPKKSLNEGVNNTMILDTVDAIQNAIKVLKRDNTLPKSETDKLFTAASPLVKILLKLVK
jgi:hypothetical protein